MDTKKNKNTNTNTKVDRSRIISLLETLISKNSSKNNSIEKRVHCRNS